MIDKVKSLPIFISGAISFDINAARVMFRNAEEMLLAEGFQIVYNPQRIVEAAGLTEKDPYAKCFAISCEYLHMSKIIFHLPGWEKSPGARMENCIAMQRYMHHMLLQGDTMRLILTTCGFDDYLKTINYYGGNYERRQSANGIQEYPNNTLSPVLGNQSKLFNRFA
jgi:hypothetical protein